MQFPQASVFRDGIGPRTRYREEALFSLLKPSHGVPPWGTCLSQRDRFHLSLFGNCLCRELMLCASEKAAEVNPPPLPMPEPALRR